MQYDRNRNSTANLVISYANRLLLRNLCPASNATQTMFFIIKSKIADLSTLNMQVHKSCLLPVVEQHKVDRKK